MAIKAMMQEINTIKKQSLSDQEVSIRHYFLLYDILYHEIRSLLILIYIHKKQIVSYKKCLIAVDNYKPLLTFNYTHCP